MSPALPRRRAPAGEGGPATAQAAVFAAALAAAARDAALPVELLGDVVPLLADAAEGRLPDAVELGRYETLGGRAAEQGATLRALVDLYLSACWRVWPALPAVTRATAAHDAPAVRDCAAGVFAVDEVLAALADGYLAARRFAARREEAQRREFIDDLLTGSADVASLLERAEAIGLRLTAPHRVVAVRADRVLADFGPVARELEATLATRLPTPDLLVASKDGLLACVLPDGAGEDIGTLIATRVQALERENHWRVTVSRSRPGATGVRRGWQEAKEALELADRLALPDVVVRADDLLAYQMLLRDRAAVGELVEHVLGPLRGARGGAGPLVETLVALFDHGGNTAATARALHLSVRAVLYRLERITELSGYDLDQPAQRFTLQAAAVGARLLAWPEEVPPPP